MHVNLYHIIVSPVISIVQYMEEQNKTKHTPFGDDDISLIELNSLSPKYPHTNSPD